MGLTVDVTTFFYSFTDFIISFSIPEKMFLKIESLMCALMAHINWTLILMSSLYYFKQNNKKEVLMLDVFYSGTV